jgi:hypothetical protein
MNKSELVQYARLGAVQRLRDLQAEMAAIQQTFPDLVGNRGRLIKQRTGTNGISATATSAPIRKRRTMSAKARAAISKAQKARWAKQKAATK